MAERDSRKERKIEEMVLVKNENETPYMEKDVIVIQTASGKNGAVYEVVNSNNERVGIIGENGKFRYDEKYRENLRKKMGPFFNELELDSREFDVILHEKEKEQQKQNDEASLQQRIEADNAKKALENEKREKEELEEDKNNTDNMENKEVNVSEEERNGKPKEKVGMTEGEIKKYASAEFIDPVYAKQFVPNLNNQDIGSLRLVWFDDGPKMMVKENDTNRYVEIPAYIGTKSGYGPIDNISHGKEELDSASGRVLTIKTRDNKPVKLDVSMSGGEMIVKDVSNRDNDPNLEAVQIRTQTYRSVESDIVKIDNEKNRDGTVDEMEKEELGIESNQNLTDEEIEKYLADKDSDVRDEVLDRLDGKEVNLKQLEKLTEDVEYDMEWVPGYRGHERRQ